MTNHEFALSDLAARLAGTDASLSTALREILSAAEFTADGVEVDASCTAGSGGHGGVGGASGESASGDVNLAVHR